MIISMISGGSLMIGNGAVAQVPGGVPPESILYYRSMTISFTNDLFAKGTNACFSAIYGPTPGSPRGEVIRKTNLGVCRRPMKIGAGMVANTAVRTLNHIHGAFSAQEADIATAEERVSGAIPVIGKVGGVFEHLYL
jgi:hypothetical protein